MHMFVSVDICIADKDGIYMVSNQRLQLPSIHKIYMVLYVMLT